MPVSLDLRRRAVEAYDAGGGSLDAVAARFAVGRASLVRWLALRRQSGSFGPRPHGGGPPPAVTPGGEVLLRSWLAENPSLGQRELARRLAGAGEPAVSQQTVGRTLRRMGYTRKKS